MLDGLSDFKYNGQKALAAIIKKSVYGSLEQAIASLTIFSHPNTVKLLKCQNVFRIIRQQMSNPYSTRGEYVEYEDGNRVMIDDNRGPTNAFIWANNIKGKDYKDVQFNHIWTMPYDVRYYTNLANICITPAFLAKITDSNLAIRDLLKYHVFISYDGFKPTNESDPPKPPIYDDIEWAPFLNPVKNLKKQYISEMKTKPKDRTTKSVREIGWFFSGYKPDKSI
jgi:hypothetical protein